MTTLTEYFEYLDELRQSGETNMFGCTPYLMREFGIDRKEAAGIVGQWMTTFDSSKTATERALGLETET